MRAMLAKLMSLFLLGLIRVLTGSQARWWGCPPKAEQRHGTRAVAARDYWTKTPFKQWITSAVFNVIYVSRARLADEDPLEPLIEALNAGDSLILFPEGTRGHLEEPQPFKAGMYNLALRFPQIELIPAWIANVQRVMPKGHLVMKALKRDRGIPIWRGSGKAITGAGGMLDRIDSLCFAAPVFCIRFGGILARSRLLTSIDSSIYHSNGGLADCF